MEVPQKISESSFSSLFKLVLGVAKDLSKFAINEKKIYNASQEYANNFLRRYGTI
jgi:hypothetical protein